MAEKSPAKSLPSWVCGAGKHCRVPFDNTMQNVTDAAYPNGQKPNTSDALYDYGGGQAIRSMRAFGLRNGGHGGLDNPILYLAVFNAGYTQAHWEGRAIPSKVHNDYGEPHTGPFAHFWVGDDGKPDGTGALHSYMGVVIRDLSDGGRPDWIEMGTGGGSDGTVKPVWNRDPSGVVIDLTKKDRTAYIEKPFPSNGLSVSGSGYPMHAVACPELGGIFYGAESWGETYFIKWDAADAVHMPWTFYPGGSYCYAMWDASRKQLICLWGGDTNYSGLKARARIRCIDFSGSDVTQPIVKDVFIADGNALVGNNGATNIWRPQGNAWQYLAKYDRIVGLNNTYDPPRHLVLSPPAKGERFDSDWTIAEEFPKLDTAVDPNGPATIVHSPTMDNELYSRSWHVPELDGVIYFMRHDVAPQLWRPSFTTGPVTTPKNGVPKR